jgi:microsomal dipeptidase-like Zn-dependent dipeptidase
MAVLDKLSVPLNGETQGTLMPKLAYRFRVNFIGMGEGDTKVATNNVVSVTRPNMTHDEVTVETYNSRIYLAGKHAWEAVTIELRDDVTSAVTKLLDKQVAAQIDMANQSSPLAGSTYKFVMTIENLDGGNPDPIVLDIWELSGCYISNLTYNETNYASGGEYQSVSIQVRFDNAAHTVLGTDYLSDPAGLIPTSTATG